MVRTVCLGVARKHILQLLLTCDEVFTLITNLSTLASNSSEQTRDKPNCVLPVKVLTCNLIQALMVNTVSSRI